MPKGLPITNPAKMPILLESSELIGRPPLKAIAVLAKAKRGKITNVTGLCY